jgi:signal transduction histidine kinase
VPDHPIVVNGDEDRISQVLHNLISNAIKFTPSGGTVTLDVAPGGGRVRISVSDTGIGLAADRRDHLFERFWQASSPVTRQYGGLGLGLAISKHIVEEHGGTVRVESEGVARGATFTVELPVLTTGTDADPVTETQTT